MSKKIQARGVGNAVFIETQGNSGDIAAIGVVTPEFAAELAVQLNAAFQECLIQGAEAMLESLLSSHLEGGHTLGGVVDTFATLAGLPKAGLFRRIHEAGGLTINNALVED